MTQREPDTGFKIASEAGRHHPHPTVITGGSAPPTHGGQQTRWFRQSLLRFERRPVSQSLA